MRWSKLKKQVEALFDPSLKLTINCISYPVKNQWDTGSAIPRFYLKLKQDLLNIEKDIIWDFPKHFIEVKKISYHQWSDDNGVSQLLREYINTPIDELMTKKFEGDTLVLHSYENKNPMEPQEVKVELGLVDLLIASDRRLGKKRLYEWLKENENPLIKLILHYRFGYKITEDDYLAILMSHDNLSETV